MNRICSLLLVVIVLPIVFSCTNGPQPKEGKEYVKIDKGLLLPVPSKNKSQFDYSRIKVTFEADGVYMRSRDMLKNAMMSISFKTPQLKPYLGHEEYKTRIGLEFKDSVDGWNIYNAPYSDFKKYTPYWTWDDVESIEFLYIPEGITPIDMLDFEDVEDFVKAKQEGGFEYEVTIYRDCIDYPIFNDSDFDEVFKLFKAHIK